MMNFFRALFGKFHPRWFAMKHRHGLDVVWSDGSTLQPYPFRRGVKSLLAPNGKEKLRLRWWTRLLLPRLAPYRPSVPRFIDTGGEARGQEAGIEYERSAPDFL